MLASEMKAVSRWIAALGGIGLAAAALAQNVDQAFHSILSAPAVIKALADLRADDARTFEEQKRITEIPAPPFKEKKRADYYLRRFQDVGLTDASIDAEGNVINVQVVEAKPEHVFDRAVIDALRRWKFERGAPQRRFDTETSSAARGRCP